MKVRALRDGVTADHKLVVGSDCGEREVIGLPTSVACELIAWWDQLDHRCEAACDVPDVDVDSWHSVVFVDVLGHAPGDNGAPVRGRLSSEKDIEIERQRHSEIADRVHCEIEAPSGLRDTAVLY